MSDPGDANSVPLFTDLDTILNIVEGDPPTLLDDNVTISDAELDAADNYAGAGLLLYRQGTNPDDVFGASGTLQFLGSDVFVNSVFVGVLQVNLQGLLWIEFNANATAARVDSVLQQITYQNTSATPPASVVIEYYFHDDEPKGPGPFPADWPPVYWPSATTGSITVNITPVDDPGPSVVPPRENDFNGDGISDILWRNDNGALGLWEQNGRHSNWQGGVANVRNDWQIADTGDFNGDGNVDILWRNTDGTVGLWEQDGCSSIWQGAIGRADNDWHIAGVADFNGDGKADILWRHDSGLIGTWEMNGRQPTWQGVIGQAPGWNVVEAGDFNGDGKDDILLRNADGHLGVWLMNGHTTIWQGGIKALSNDWQVVDAADFNGDGKDDILLHNSSGWVGMWEMNGAGTSWEGGLQQLPSDWHFAGTADTNGDGKSDILLRNDSGIVGLWEMDGHRFAWQGTIGNAPNDWHIVV